MGTSLGAASSVVVIVVAMDPFVLFVREVAAKLGTSALAIPPGPLLGSLGAHGRHRDPLGQIPAVAGRARGRRVFLWQDQSLELVPAF